MVTVSTRHLKDRLSSYLHRAECGEQIVVLRDGKPVAALVSLEALQPEDEDSALMNLEAQGMIIRPIRESEDRFRHDLLPAQGKLASEMVIEDRD